VSKDFYHDAVIKALEKSGWSITDDPLAFRVGEVDFKVDLGAELLIGAQKEDLKIAVEIKTFIGQSLVSSFHQAVGQYENYRIALNEIHEQRTLYLAIPLLIWDEFFQRPFIQRVVEVRQISLFVYDPEKEIITLWKN